MTKLTTAKIKEELNNVILKTDWKRATKRKFEYNNVIIRDHNDNLITLNGKLNWRGYYSDETEPTFVIDDGENILFMGSERPLLPPSCFSFGLYFYPYCDTFFFSTRLLVDIAEDMEVYPDNIYDDCVAGVQEHQTLRMNTVQENDFEIYEIVNDDTIRKFDNTPENYNFLKSELEKMGFRHLPDFENLILKNIV